MEDDDVVGDQEAADDNNDAVIVVELRKASWPKNQLGQQVKNSTGGTT